MTSDTGVNGFKIVFAAIAMEFLKLTLFKMFKNVYKC